MVFNLNLSIFQLRTFQGSKKKKPGYFIIDMMSSASADPEDTML